MQFRRIAHGGNKPLLTTMTPTSPGPGETLSVQNPSSGWPTDLQTLLIGSEYIDCSGRVGSVITVLARGVRSSVAASHVINDNVKYVQTTPTRFNVTWSGNVGTQAFSGTTLLGFARCDGVTVTDNTQTITSGEPTNYAECSAVLELNNSWNDTTIEGAMSYSDYLEDRINDAVCNAVNLAVPQVYVQLHTADPGENGSNSIAAENTRKAVTFAASSAGVSANNANVTWNGVAGSERIRFISYWDAVTAGNCLATGPLTGFRDTIAGESFQFLTGALTFTST